MFPPPPRVCQTVSAAPPMRVSTSQIRSLPAAKTRSVESTATPSGSGIGSDAVDTRAWVRRWTGRLSLPPRPAPNSRSSEVSRASPVGVSNPPAKCLSCQPGTFTTMVGVTPGPRGGQSESSSPPLSSSPLSSSDAVSSSAGGLLSSSSAAVASSSSAVGEVSSSSETLARSLQHSTAIASKHGPASLGTDLGSNKEPSLPRSFPLYIFGPREARFACYRGGPDGALHGRSTVDLTNNLVHVILWVQAGAAARGDRAGPAGSGAVPPRLTGMGLSSAGTCPARR